MRLSKSFFNRDTNIVAKELLGKKIVRVFPDGQRLEAIITETEAYHGLDDKASHASRKKTERNKIMFEKAGLVYVYLVYGMHHCLNFVTMEKGFPAAVLIRSAAVKDKKLKTKDGYHPVKGPGKLTKILGLDKSFYGEDLITSKRIWVETIEVYSCVSKKQKYDIIASGRVGVDYAGECKDWEWNYKINF